MGGIGSGTWPRWQERKPTVEESLVLAIATFRDSLRPGTTGTISWNIGSAERASVRFSIGWSDPPNVTLSYTWASCEDIVTPISLQTTPGRFGGRRFWFSCPMPKEGVACDRRAGKLYLPPGSKFFGCRACHRLTYKSAQEAHQTERLFGRIAREMGFDETREIVRGLMARYN